MDRYRAWPRISDMTPDERLTAAAIIMRDGIEQVLYERALREAAERDAIGKHNAEAAPPEPRIYPADCARNADMQ